MLREVIREDKLDTDQPEIEFGDKSGRINADLTIGVDAGSTAPLRANEGLCSRGMAMHGAGFIVTPQSALHLGLGKKPGLEEYIRPYRHGRDLLQLPRGLMVIDLDGLAVENVRARFPEVYQHLLATVKPERDKNNEEYRRINWWLFGRRNTLYRGFKAGLSRYIGTAETSKHRIFVFLDGDIIADNMIVNVGSDDAYVLGVLSSRAHTVWTLLQGGTLEDRPRYTKSLCFDPFPFPSPGDLLKTQIRSVAEELDAFRKARQQEHPSLTLTQMYNVLEKVKAMELQQLPSPPGLSRGSTPSSNAADKHVDGRDKPGHDAERISLTPDEERIKNEGLILILKELHEKLDQLVFQAYGWPETLTDEEIIAKLVALNHERAAEEKRGHVRWLRPEYQIPRFGKAIDKMAAKEEGAQIAAELGLPEQSARKPSFPSDAVAQTAAVFAALAASRGPVSAAAIAANFRKTKTLETTIAGVLASLHRLGHLATKDGKTFELRRAA